MTRNQMAVHDAHTDLSPPTYNSRNRPNLHPQALSARGPTSLGPRPVLWNEANSAMPVFDGKAKGTLASPDPEESTQSTSYDPVKPGKELPTGPSPPRIAKPPHSEVTKPMTLSAKLAPRVRPLLVLDMDETLLRSEANDKEGYDLVVKAGEDKSHDVFVKIRPYAREFIRACAKFADIYVFTASNQDYCDPVLDAVDEDKLIEKRFYNPDCTKYDGTKYEKDLRKMGKPLRQVILVDNSPEAWRNQPQNAIRVSSWFGNKHDTQLLDLIPILETTFLHYADVREALNANTRSFKSLGTRAKRLNPKVFGKYDRLRLPEHRY